MATTWPTRTLLLQCNREFLRCAANLTLVVSTAAKAAWVRVVVACAWVTMSTRWRRSCRHPKNGDNIAPFLKWWIHNVAIFAVATKLHHVTSGAPKIRHSRFGSKRVARIKMATSPNDTPPPKIKWPRHLEIQHSPFSKWQLLFCTISKMATHAKKPCSHFKNGTRLQPF